MSTVLRAQIELRNDSFLPEHASVNVMHFVCFDADPSSELTSITAAIETFYQTADAVLGSVLTGDGIVKFYDLLDPQPRAPIGTEAFTFSPQSGDCFPNEVAVVLSVQGEGVSGVPIARRRGRVYLGPIAASTGVTAGGDTFLSSAGRDAVALAGEQLAAEIDPLHWAWVVFSPTIAGTQPWSEAELESASTLITNGWVNNAYDTQRSRGLNDTARTVWAV